MDDYLCYTLVRSRHCPAFPRSTILFPVLLDEPGPLVLESEGGEGVGGDGADDEEQVEEREGQQHVVERVLAHLLAEKSEKGA